MQSTPPLTDALSDNAVSSLMKIYAALHNLVVTCGLDDTYGDRRIYGAAIDRLYRICRRRCTKRYSFARRSRMMSVLHDSLYGTCRGLGSDKLESCCKHIASRNHKEEDTPDYIRLSMSEPRSADTDDYRHWARSLRNAIP